MHAALSVMVFTVLSGAGLGAYAFVAIADLGALAEGRAAASAGISCTAVVALALVIAGLCASTLHLANPRNAWRSASRFRTSWLSREAVFALSFVALALAWLLLRWIGQPAWLRGALAALSCALAWVVVYCTAMIYASLKPIRAWHTWRVPAGYLLLAHATGGVLVVALARQSGTDVRVAALATMLLVALAALAKWEYRRYLAGDRDSVTLEDALGVARGVRGPAAPATVAARLLDVGHSRGTFLTREFMVTPTPRHRAIALWVMVVAGYALPLVWLGFGSPGNFAGLVVFVLMLAGTLCERWLFFVEARHTVRLYHGDRRT